MTNMETCYVFLLYKSTWLPHVSIVLAFGEFFPPLKLQTPGRCIGKCHQGHGGVEKMGEISILGWTIPLKQGEKHFIPGLFHMRSFIRTVNVA